MLDMLHSLTCLIIVHLILLIFLNFVTYTPLLGPSHLLVFEIFLNGIFININEKKSFLKTGDLKSTQHWLRFLFNKKLRNCVYFFTCILPNYVADDITKEFWKYIWQLVFFKGVKTYFGELPLKRCVFINGKNQFSQILPSNNYCSH